MGSVIFYESKVKKSIFRTRLKKKTTYLCFGLTRKIILLTVSLSGLEDLTDFGLD